MGLPLPKEKNPHRPRIDEAEYQTLLRVAPEIDWRFEVALALAHETGHRISAIRQLRWGDVDLDEATVTWRAAHDKTGVEHTTPLTDAAVRVLTRSLQRQRAIGAHWVLPSPRFPDRPCGRPTLATWMMRAKRKAGLGDRKGLGYHSLRRKFATDLKGIPQKDLLARGGWKDPKTLLTYQQSDLDAMREALSGRSESTHPIHSPSGGGVTARTGSPLRAIG